MLSPQQWDDLVLSSNKKEVEERAIDLEWTALKLKKQLDRNREFNESYLAQLQGCRSQSEHRAEEQEQYYSQPYPLSDEESQQQPQKEYLKRLIKKYHKQPKQGKLRECCQPKHMDMPRQQQPKKYMPYSKEEVWQRLLEDKRAALELREQEKRKQMDEQVEQECTFKPQISELASRRHTDQPVEERLYYDSFEQKRRREQLKHEQLQSEQYAFRPDVSNAKTVLKGDQLLQKPLYERIDEVLKKKQEELVKMQQEKMMASNATYQPKLTQKSIMIAEQKLTQKSVIERLMEDAAQKLHKKIAHVGVEQRISEECTFNPEINPTMRDVQEINQACQMQYMMADFMREKKEKLMQEFFRNSEYLFKPQINRQSELIVESNEDRLNEKPTEKFARLGQKDFEKNRILKEQLNQIYYEQFTFKPAINPLSKMIARKRSLDTLAYNPERKEKLKQLKEEQDSKQTCSFYPQTSKTSLYQHVKSKYEQRAIKQNIEMEKELKERKVQDLKRQIEYTELKDCTFKPMTKQYQKDEAAISEKVKGMDKFMQNKENIKRQQKQKEERERQVFNLEQKYDYKSHLEETKPQPFKLSQNNICALRQLQEEAQQREKETCTFQPKINKNVNFI